MLNLRKLEEEQSRLSKKVVIKNEFEELTLIAGLDHSYFDRQIIAGIVVCTYPELEIVEKKFSIQPSRMPYIPGFLAYREMPAAADAYSRLENKPHVLLVDGNGILHPRGLGVASHFGVLQDLPTIGVAKNLFTGEVRNSKVYIGDKAIGQEMQTKEKAKPLYVSPGHRITLTKAMEVITACMRPPHKLPEPLHLAHRYVRKLKELEEAKVKRDQPAQAAPEKENEEMG